MPDSHAKARVATRPAAAVHLAAGLTQAALGFLATVILAIAPARAQGPTGVGFAQAEEGTFMCRGENAETALGCAQEACVDGAMGQDCVPTTYCFPAGYAGTVTVFLSDFHTTRPICGAPSADALIAALQAFCDGTPEATGCFVAQAWDPDGTELPELSQDLVPGGDAAPAAK